MSADSMAQIGPTARLVCSVPGSRRPLNGALTRRRVDVDQVFTELPASGGFPNPAALLRLAGAVVSRPTTNGTSARDSTSQRDVTVSPEDAHDVCGVAVALTLRRDQVRGSRAGSMSGAGPLPRG
jgi:hypothetical protein